MHEPALPQVKRSKWVRNPIDRFILASQEAAGLMPAPEADKPTLIRRLTFDLIGLPPTPHQTLEVANTKAELLGGFPLAQMSLEAPDEFAGSCVPQQSSAVIGCCHHEDSVGTEHSTP